MFADFKSKILKLLEEDEEFRYAVAGLLGLSEILKRLDSLVEEQTKIWMEIRGLREEQTKMWGEIGKVWEELRALREDMVKGFERHDRILEKHSEELTKLREEQTKMWGEIKTLREDMNEGFRLLRRHIDALGARWGLLAEKAFREGLRGLVEKVFGGRVERWSHYDEEGFVFGHPSIVEADLIVRDRKHILVEVKSSVSRGDIYELWRIGKLYEKVRGVKPKLAIVSPYIDATAKKMAERLGIEIYVP